MSEKLKTLLLLPGVAVMLSLSACNGIFGDIYDTPTPEQDSEYGFVAVDEQKGTGRIYINATDYSQWHYINLHRRQVVTAPAGGEAPAEWDFAVHRYDAKTRGGAVAETTAPDFSLLPGAAALPEEAFVQDEWTTDKIAIDMSQMMEGTILYAEDYYNPCLSQWLDVDTSTMPPVYTLSGKVYLLRLPDGTCAALRLTNFMSPAAIKGFMTIDYLYPVQL